MKVGYFVQAREGMAMGKLSRTRVKRLWYAGLVGIWIVPFVLASMAIADTAFVTAEGQGWFWKNRPQHGVPITEPTPGTSVGGDLYCYNAPGGKPCESQWKPDHLYVGWDGQQLKAEMISAVNFDLSSIPDGSSIIRFTFTLKQHPSGADHSHTPNYTSPATHGIVACPWPEFFAGAAEVEVLTDDMKEERICGDSITGTPATVDPAVLAVPSATVDWTFDLSPIATDWKVDVNPSISIEPDPRSKSAVSWITSFHRDTIYHDPSTGEVTTNPNHVPGVYANVTYLLPSGEEESGVVSGDLISEFDGSGEAFAFGDSEGLAGDLGASSEPAEPVAPEEPQLAAGVFEGQPAGFWAYPIAWFAALLGFILLGFAGKALQAEPGGARPPGAAAALMRGNSPSA